MIMERWDSAPIYLYHHHDGYFEGVGNDLCERLKKCQFWHSANIATALVKDANDEYEITTGLHGDIEYLYKIYCGAKFMEVWAVDYSNGKEVWILAREISFKEEKEGER